ncbi:MAG: A/G-specific adenine glycosylase [Parvibaculum sp.]
MIKKVPAKAMGKNQPKASDLLAWYDVHARHLPWRARGGRTPDPYAVWLSEIMLQQTTVATVGPYFRAFLDKWPTVKALGAADIDEVMHAWAGLGYYSRARNLHACACHVATELNGVFPDTEEELMRLPGIGPYTAAAVAAIAFDRPATVVDGNVERVVARLFQIEEMMPAAKKIIREKAATLTPEKRPGDFAQAMMDLGATLCSPRNPTCTRCPWEKPCKATKAGNPDALPRRAPKKERPTRYGTAFWAVRSDGAVLLRKRPPKGLLGGMMEVPSSDWVEGTSLQEADLAHAAPVKAKWEKRVGRVEHTFTHFHLILELVEARVAKSTKAPTPDCVWVLPEDLGKYALPTVMKKIVTLVLGETEKPGPPIKATRA